ncbi:uncharacterized protein LOC122277109 [Carya illinoinensis]|uniref:uncharacterized protein LOC122277109 n=1 Tax=Carya illinoinensis TaxID=32201 RepID=UPI001C71A466|nr:uncharacterized protein LOC122277109 [Carya illinoinensis]
MAAMVGIGSERSAEATGLKDSTMWWSLLRVPEEDLAAWAQDRSNPLEKNLPWAVLVRVESRTAWDLTWERIEMREMTVGLKRCSPSPVSVRKKISWATPLFPGLISSAKLPPLRSKQCLFDLDRVG